MKRVGKAGEQRDWYIDLLGEGRYEGRSLMGVYQCAGVQVRSKRKHRQRQRQRGTSTSTSNEARAVALLVWEVRQERLKLAQFKRVMHDDGEGGRREPDKGFCRRSRGLCGVQLV